MSRGTPATDAYLDLKARAKRDSRSTQELLQLYLLEGFLARLAASELRDLFVLKGGVLLAAFDARRPTRDVDLAGIQIANDAAVVLELVRTVLDIDLDDDDGIKFRARDAVAETIREDDEYAGVRVSATATLATARLSFHVDVNVGDPIWPAPEAVAVPRLRGGPAIQLTGYPLHMVHAERHPARNRQHPLARLRRHLDPVAPPSGVGGEPARSDSRGRGLSRCRCGAGRPAISCHDYAHQWRTEHRRRRCSCR